MPEVLTAIGIVTVAFAVAYVVAYVVRWVAWHRRWWERDHDGC